MTMTSVPPLDAPTRKSIPNPTPPTAPASSAARMVLPMTGYWNSSKTGIATLVRTVTYSVQSANRRDSAFQPHSSRTALPTLSTHTGDIPHA